MFNDIDVPNTTKVLFHNEARRKLYVGLCIAAEAVTCTLGPRGRTVLIQSKGGPPTVTKDGVTVIKSIRLKDPVEKMGAELIREAASQTNEVAGDGTTTATVLTHSMVKEGLKLLEAGYSAKELCEGIQWARELVDNELKKSARVLNTSAEIAQVGTISANGDTKIGELIAEAMEKVGRDGIITVEDAKGMATTLEVVEGMQFERGYMSPYFVTNPERMNVSYQEALVLVTDKKLSGLRELVPVLEKVAGSRKPLLIIADDVEGEALQGLVINRVNGNLPLVAVKAPGYGKHRDELLADICTLTGARLVSSSTGVKFDTLTLADLGVVKRLVVDAKSTTLVGSGATKSKIDEHVANLRTQLEDVTISTEEVVKLKTRIAKLASGVAVIRVGGATEVEMIERKYRIEDALNATRAAAEEGIVKGGGMALVDAHHSLASTLAGLSSNSTVLAGANIVMAACLAPLSKIAANAGKTPEVILERVDSGRYLSDIQHRGWNASSGKDVDMFQTGIIDPVKVTRTALKNAASVAITFLTLDAVVVEEQSSSKEDNLEKHA